MNIDYRYIHILPALNYCLSVFPSVVGVEEKLVRLRQRSRIHSDIAERSRERNITTDVRLRLD